MEVYQEFQNDEQNLSKTNDNQLQIEENVENSENDNFIINNGEIKIGKYNF